MKMVGTCGVGPYGQRSKVDACVQLLHYMQIDGDYNEDLQPIQVARARLQNFKKQLRQEEKKQSNMRTEEEARTDIGPKENENIWNKALFSSNSMEKSQKEPQDVIIILR